MDGRELIKKHGKEIVQLRKEISKTRDIVAKYANSVDASIHTVERTIDAREAVRRIDFARDLLKLAAYHMELAYGGWEREIPLLSKKSHDGQ